MHAKKVRELVRLEHKEGRSYSKISHQLKLTKSIVHDVIEMETITKNEEEKGAQESYQ